MGCDIHFHAEVKIKGTWYHHSEREIPRSYPLFSLMADVRNNEGRHIEPISKPKGLPDDPAEYTLFRYRYDVKQYPPHSMSWLSAEEILTLSERVKELPNIIRYTTDNWRYNYWFEETFGDFYGNTWPGFAQYPESRPTGVEDIRFVFWFDN